jgi:hypothetical protein
MEAALRLIPAKTRLLVIEGGGHDLGFKGNAAPERAIESVMITAQEFFLDS